MLPQAQRFRTKALPKRIQQRQLLSSGAKSSWTESKQASALLARWNYLTRMTVDQTSSELLEFKQFNPPALYFEQKNKMRKELCFSQKAAQKLNMQVYFGIACIHKGQIGGKNWGKRASMQKCGPLTTPLKSLPRENKAYFLYIKIVKTQKEKYSEEHILKLIWNRQYRSCIIYWRVIPRAFTHLNSESEPQLLFPFLIRT